MCAWNEAWRMASWVWSEGCGGVPSWEDGTGNGGTAIRKGSASCAKSEFLDGETGKGDSLIARRAGREPSLMTTTC